MYAFSFCLYNPHNPFYYDGLLENISIIKQHFPGWGIYVYIGNDVPSWFLEKLAAAGCRIRMTQETGHKTMIHRFFAIDEPDVDAMFVRDADSRVHWKDRWAIRKFLESPYIAHTIRDHPEHIARMMGGLWALKKSPRIPSIRALYEEYKATGNDVSRVGNDQVFLGKHVYPLVKSSLLVHYSHMSVLYPFEHAVQFPFEWSDSLYCGKN